MTTPVTPEIKELGSTLLNIGAYLMSSGANSRRIRMTIERISKTFNCTTELLITHRALMISVSDENEEHFHSSLKRTMLHGVNFKVVSAISKMSWQVVEERWTIQQINSRLDEIVKVEHYPRLAILTMVALAGASFCRLSGGEWLDMLVTFFATFVGLFVRQEAIKHRFNPYVCIFFAAFTSSLISGVFVRFVPGIQINAFSTSVLYLIPGVPLINSFSDLIHGNIMNGIVRSVNGIIIAFSIALGLMIAKLIFQI